MRQHFPLTCFKTLSVDPVRIWTHNRSHAILNAQKKNPRLEENENGKSNKAKCPNVCNTQLKNESETA